MIIISLIRQIILTEFNLLSTVGGQQRGTGARSHMDWVNPEINQSINQSFYLIIFYLKSSFFISPQNLTSARTVAVNKLTNHFSTEKQKRKGGSNLNSQ